MFLNSIKMKIAVTLGVIHMLTGVVMSFINHLHFNDRIKAIFEFIPRFLFMTFTFGYMIFMIVLKMCVDWQMFGDQEPRDPPPPNLIQVMINMFLSPPNMPAEYVMFEGQHGIHVLLLTVAVICVPIMLILPPYLKHKCGNSHAYQDLDLLSGGTGIQQSVGYTDTEDEEYAYDMEMKRQRSNSSAKHDQHGDEGDHGHSFGDDMIHNAIHTIEYILGCVSNTASYLRLWALSLAHAQLAEVFWNMLLMDYGLLLGPVTGVVGVGAWAGATFGVLLMMDVLECFLHSLRLHWVEFQNKFFYGDGVAFEPFAFD